MPRKMQMSWTGAKRRWRKMYRGVVYTVFCSELDLPEDQWTELGSYQAANDWWVAKRAEIDQRTGRTALPPEAEAVLQTLRAKRLYAEKEGLGGEAAVYAAAVHEAEEQVAAGEVELSGVDPTVADRLQLLELLGGKPPPGADADTLERLFGSKELWSDRQRRDRAVAASKRIGTHLDDWYALVHRRAKASSVTNIHGYYREFKDLRSGKTIVLHENMDVGAINEAKYMEVFRAIEAQEGLSTATKKKKWSYFKNFVTYLGETGQIVLPKNFRSKLLSFRTRSTSKAAPDVPAIRAFLDSLPDRLKLYALLALNCGMNNVDIAHLKDEQIDWAERTLTRKRHKTEDMDGVPTVTYALWAETTRLLRQERNAKSEFVLTSRTGECLYVAGKVGDSAKLYDRIKSQWRDYFKGRGGSPFTLKQFRFFGADLLKDNRGYRSYRGPFLGHAPLTTAEKSYSSDEDVSPACRYLERLFSAKVGQPAPTTA